MNTNVFGNQKRRPRIKRMGADKKNDEIRIPNDERMPTAARESPTFAGLLRKFSRAAGAAGANRRDNILIKDKSFALIRVIRG
jgi:hypothetical protein